MAFVLSEHDRRSSLWLSLTRQWRAELAEAKIKALALIEVSRTSEALLMVGRVRTLEQWLALDPQSNDSPPVAMPDGDEA